MMGMALLVSLDRLGLVNVSFNERSLSFGPSLLSLCAHAKLCLSYPALLARSYCRNFELAKEIHRRIYSVHSYKSFHRLCDHTLRSWRVAISVVTTDSRVPTSSHISGMSICPTISRRSGCSYLRSTATTAELVDHSDRAVAITVRFPSTRDGVTEP